MDGFGIGMGMGIIGIAMACWGIADSFFKSRGAGASAEDLNEARRHTALLADENEQLTGKIGRLEERLATLERIATDPARRTAEEIERLRD